MNKIVIIILAILVVTGLFLFIPIKEKSTYERIRETMQGLSPEKVEWIIDGDRVYTDDDKAYISATPHTLEESGWVYFDVKSKVYDGNVDVVLGVDNTQLVPRKAEYYNPQPRVNQIGYRCDFENSYFNYTTNPKHFWCYNNRTNNQTQEKELILVYNHSFDGGDVEKSYAYWLINSTDEWQPLKNFQSTNHEHGGMNKWFYIKNFPIVSNQTYKIRVFFEIPRAEGFTPIKLDTKYWFAIKPSSETIQEAIANDHLYALDPWLNSSGDQNKDYLTEDLYIYLNLNESAGNIGEDIVNATHNATLVNMNDSSWVSGKIGNALLYDGNNDAIWINETSIYNSWGDSFTACLWIYADNWTSMDQPLSLDQESVKRDWFLRFVSGGGLKIDLIGSGAIETSAFAMNEWFHACIGVNSSSLWLATNGTLRNITSTRRDTQTGTAQPIVSGYSRYYGNYWFGRVDEIAWWNRSLNSTEIQDIFNNTLTYSPVLPPPADESPAANLTAPLNNTNLSATSYVLRCNTTDDQNIQNIYFYVDDVRNKTYTIASVTTAWNQTYNLSGLADASYLLKCEACDNATTRQCTNSTSANLTIDTTAPTISMDYPTNTSYNTNVSELNYTYSDTGTEGDSCLYSIDDGATNSSIASEGTNFTGITSVEGNNTWNVWCNDSAGNIGNNVTTFFKDTVHPYFTNWANQTVYSNESLHYDIDAADDGIGFGTFAINWSGTFSINDSGGLINSTNLSIGTHYRINVTINDTAGNENSSILDVYFRTTQNIYDEIDDSFLNDSLWDNSTDVKTHGAYCSAETFENNYYIEANASCYNATATIADNVTSFVFSNNMSAIADINNITARVVLTGVNGVAAIFNALGHQIAIVGNESNDSVWDFRRNSSSTNNTFSVYANGVFITSINATNNTLELENHVTGDLSIARSAVSRIHYVYYIGGAGQVTVNLDRPADNYVTVNNHVYFNLSASSSSNDLQNASLYIDHVFNDTNNMSGLSNITAFNITGFAQGNYNWSVIVCNNESSCTTSSTRFFNVSNFTENSMTYNTTTYETDTEEFVVNITALSAPTGAILVYNGTEYSTTVTAGSANTYIINRTLSLPAGVGNHSFYFSMNLGNTSTYYQAVNPVVFVQCNATITSVYLNVTFRNESNEVRINASIPAASFTYWLGDQATNNTYAYSNATAYNEYNFCFSPTGRTVSTSYSISYTDTGFPQRTYTNLSANFTNTTTHLVLYLEHTSSGLYVTFQVVNPADQPIESVYVTAERSIGGSDVVVGSGYTDSAGAITFWLNPDFSHTFTFVRSGYDTYATVITPTQSTYTITLSETITSTTYDFHRGVSYTIIPSEYTLINDTNYTFNFTITSSYWELEEYGFILRNGSGTSFGSVSDTSSTGGTVSLPNINTGNNSTVVMDFYWVVTGNYTNSSRTWSVVDELDYGFSLRTFFTDLKRFTEEGIFGLNDFSRTLLIFIFIFVVVGGLSYVSGVYSVGAVLVELLALTFLFDFVFDMFPTIASVDHFPTIFLTLLGIVYILWGWAKG